MLGTLQDNDGGGGGITVTISCLQLQRTKPCIKQFTFISVNAFKSGAWSCYLHFTDESVILVDFGEQGVEFEPVLCSSLRTHERKMKVLWPPHI